MIAEALQDEPDWRRILRVENVEFRTGTANEPPPSRKGPGSRLDS
jgi:hypothetical protein